ncbi:MAG: Rieske 2Fe-2S domain-containing protein [Cyclobacteriaceae bacterium]|jgi:3-phenylpropionate/trans-cinnamate dioxygenase ferredoxin subunit|nr:Rieske 2Fe-2S domain-containing protein [Cyclobacteriaceae bacterium]
MMALQWIQLFGSLAEAEARVAVNQPALAVVNGKRICLVRTAERWFAVADRCTHRGESLSRGQLNYRSEILCPWHGYCFDLRTGRESLERARDLETFPIELRDEGLFVGL